MNSLPKKSKRYANVTAFHQGFSNTSFMMFRPTTTICIPAHNEAATIARSVGLARRARKAFPHVVADILVVDDRSTDETGAIAKRHGARVVQTARSACLPFGSSGKGDALTVGVHNCTTELITFLDADVTELDVEFVDLLTAPLRRNRGIKLVKGSFCRSGGSSDSGRVTMLTALPLLRILHPQASTVREPLGGMFAARRETLAALTLESDYGVDIGLLIDVIERHGRSSVAEVNLGALAHRRRDLEALSKTAEQVARAILVRSRHSIDDVVATSGHFRLVGDRDRVRIA